VALVEVILAALLLGIGLSVALSLASTSIARQRLGEQNLVAAWLADEQMSLVVMDGPEMYLQNQQTTGQFEPPFEDYSYEVIVKHVGDWEPYEVTVFIDWDEKRRFFQLESLIAPRQGEPEEPEDRRPLEAIDREAIYYEDIIE
tara:strand:- start:520 stop:951 length:432 start_codon:yes stop_codon:yes gene_type:complete